jgi:hypothetical protein
VEDNNEVFWEDVTFANVLPASNWGDIAARTLCFNMFQDSRYDIPYTNSDGSSSNVQSENLVDRTIVVISMTLGDEKLL